MKMASKRRFGQRMGWNSLTLEGVVLTAIMALIAGVLIADQVVEKELPSAREKASAQTAIEGLPLRRVGDWDGYEVLWVNDSSRASRSKGFYAFKASAKTAGKSDFQAPALVGEVGGEPLYYVRDTHGASRAPGFYAIERAGRLLPMTASGASSGKSSISYGAAMMGADGRLDMGEGSELSKMSAAQLEELSTKAKEMAAAKRAAVGQ